jgi:hypothetical protein
VLGAFAGKLTSARGQQALQPLDLVGLGRLGRGQRRQREPGRPDRVAARDHQRATRQRAFVLAGITGLTGSTGLGKTGIARPD